MTGYEEDTVRVHQEDGGLWAELVELPGCFASGDDEPTLIAALEEAIGMYLSSPDSYVRAVIKEFGPGPPGPGHAPDEFRVLVSA